VEETLQQDLTRKVRSVQGERRQGANDRGDHHGWQSHHQAHEQRLLDVLVLPYGLVPTYGEALPAHTVFGWRQGKCYQDEQGSVEKEIDADSANGQEAGRRQTHHSNTAPHTP